MNTATKIGLYIVLLLCAVLFGQRFYGEYSRVMNDSAVRGGASLEDVRLPGVRNRQLDTADRESNLGVNAFGFFASVVVLGIMVGHEVSRYFGGRTLKVLFNDEGEGMGDPDYEIAEQEWANGNHLESINLMREYLAKNPREQHVALRIAEIYEKDLHNYLAAALEYEDVLKQKLKPDRWGWAAIHLCNLYSSKLDQPDKGIALLRRIDAEYPQTAAAEKARKRLAEIDEVSPVATDEQASENEAPTPEESSQAASNLPPGFTPKKG